MRFLTFFYILVLCLYLAGVSPSVYGGDSGDVILASWFAGVAHPPGYPLTTIFGWFFAHLPFDWTIAYKVNLASVFLQAAGVALLFLILKKLTNNIIASLLGALVLAFNPLYWLYAHVYEVFQLNIVLLGLSTYFLVSWRQDVLKRKKKLRDLYLSFLFWGLAVFHHHTSILLAPAYIYLVLKTNKKAFFANFVYVKAGIFFVLGFLPYIYIPIAALRQTPINWDDPSNIHNFIRLILRQDYGTFTAANFLIGSTVVQKFIQLLYYFLFLKADFSIFGLFFIVIGATYAFFRQKPIFWFIFLAFFVSGPFFLFYAGFPISTDFLVGLWERFLLTSYFYVSLFLGIGVSFFINSISPFILRKIRFSSLNYRKTVFSLSLFVFPFALFFINYPKTDLSSFYLGDWLAQDILASAEPNSIILTAGDTALFNTQYVFYTQNKPDGKKVIKAGSLAFLEYRRQVAKEFPELIYPEKFFSAEAPDSAKFVGILIEANEGKYPVYIRDFLPEALGYRWMTVGLLKKLVKEEDYNKDDLVRYNEKAYENFKYSDFGADVGYAQYITGHLKDHYYTSLTDLVREFIANQDHGNAIKYSQMAQTLSPEKKDAYILLGYIYSKNKECSSAEKSFKQIIALDNNDWLAYEALAQVYENCFDDAKKSEEYKNKARQVKPDQNIQDLDKF